MMYVLAFLVGALVFGGLVAVESSRARCRAEAKHRREMWAAEQVCQIYFEIAEDEIGEDEVRLRRDTRMAADGWPGKQADVIWGLLRKLGRPREPEIVSDQPPMRTVQVGKFMVEGPSNYRFEWDEEQKIIRAFRK